LEQA
jgi:hypothetical protein